jgi:hypothetical protein
MVLVGQGVQMPLKKLVGSHDEHSKVEMALAATIAAVSPGTMQRRGLANKLLQSSKADHRTSMRLEEQGKPPLASRKTHS